MFASRMRTEDTNSAVAKTLLRMIADSANKDALLVEASKIDITCGNYEAVKAKVVSLIEAGDFTAVEAMMEVGANDFSAITL